jgi:hypothetical protein
MHGAGLDQAGRNGRWPPAHLPITGGRPDSCGVAHSEDRAAQVAFGREPPVEPRTDTDRIAGPEAGLRRRQCASRAASGSPGAAVVI